MKNWLILRNRREIIEKQYNPPCEVRSREPSRSYTCKKRRIRRLFTDLLSVVRISIPIQFGLLKDYTMAALLIMDVPFFKTTDTLILYDY